MALADLPDARRAAAVDFLTAVGDDEFVHGERVRQWLTVAPTLEEDNVLTSVAQDELGHARLWYDLVAEYRETTVDDLAIFRPAAERYNSTLVEREHADFADAAVRMFCYDAAEALLLEALSGSRHEEIAGPAGAAASEETFHREHADRWVEVFEHVEERDRERVRSAVETNLAHAGDLFAFATPGRLVDAGVLDTAPATLEAEWRGTVVGRLAALPVGLDEDDLAALLDDGCPNGRAGEHTDDLADLVETIQPSELERLDV